MLLFYRSMFSKDWPFKFFLSFCFSSTSSDLLLLIFFPSLSVENGVIMAFSILSLSHNHRKSPRVSNVASDTVVFYYKFLVLVSFYSQIDIYFSFDMKLIYEYKSHTPRKPATHLFLFGFLRLDHHALVQQLNLPFASNSII